MKGIIVAAVIGGMCLIGLAEGAELTQHDRGFNWQDREYFGQAYVYRTLGGGDAAAATGESGDAGAAAGTGSGSGATGGGATGGGNSGGSGSSDSK